MRPGLTIRMKWKLLRKTSCKGGLSPHQKLQENFSHILLVLKWPGHRPRREPHSTSYRTMMNRITMYASTKTLCHCPTRLGTVRLGQSAACTSHSFQKGSLRTLSWLIGTLTTNHHTRSLFTNYYSLNSWLNYYHLLYYCNNVRRIYRL